MVKEPLSLRARDDVRQTELIRQAWFGSGRVYGFRKLSDDLRDQGEQVSENRVAQPASLGGIMAQVGYKRRPGRYGGKPAVVASNALDRQFEGDAPDRVWVTDITYIKTHAGWRPPWASNQWRHHGEPGGRDRPLLAARCRMVRPAPDDTSLG